MIFPFIREQRHEAVKRDAVSGAAKSGLDGRFIIFVAIMFLFTLGNSSDAFLILRAQNLGSSVLDIALMLLAFNLVYAGICLPAGLLSDKIGRRRVLVLSWLVYGFIYAGFATGVGSMAGMAVVCPFWRLLRLIRRGSPCFYC
jgi:MFS family permease